MCALCDPIGYVDIISEKYGYSTTVRGEVVKIAAKTGEDLLRQEDRILSPLFPLVAVR